MIKNIYKKHKEWFSLFSSAFIGTLLGIGITFGISAYLEHQSKEEMAHKILIVTLDEIQNHIKKIEQAIPEMRHTDSVFNDLLSYYPESIDKVPDSLGMAFTRELYALTIDGDPNFAEKIFLNNIESLEAFDDLSIISDITHLFTWINSFNNIRNRAEEIKKAMLNAYIAKENIYLTDNEVLQNFFEKNNKVLSDFFFHESYTEALSALIELTKKDFNSIKRNLGITEKDMENTTSYRREKIDFNNVISDKTVRLNNFEENKAP